MLYMYSIFFDNLCMFVWFVGKNKRNTLVVFGGFFTQNYYKADQFSLRYTCTFINIHAPSMNVN